MEETSSTNSRPGPDNNTIKEGETPIESTEFPRKPETDRGKQSAAKSLISMALFIVLFYLVFQWEFKYILVLAGVVLIHELGHFLAMRIFNYDDLSIFFVPLVGAFAAGTKETVSQKQNTLILLAGPLPGVVIGLVFYYFGLKSANEFLLRTSNIFIIINLFNLLPIMPLDGGKIIKTIFFQSKTTINNIFVIASILVLSYVAISLKSYFLLIIPFFLFMQLQNQNQVNKLRKRLKSKGFEMEKTYSELTDGEYWLIRDEIGSQMKAYERYISPGDYTISKIENRIVGQVKQILQKEPLDDLKLAGKILVTLVWILSFIIPAVVVAVYYIRLGLI